MDIRHQSKEALKELRGIMLGSKVTLIDGNQTVLIRHEIVTDRGAAFIIQKLNPRKDSRVKVENGSAIEYPKIPADIMVTFRGILKSSNADNGWLRLEDAERIS